MIKELVVSTAIAAVTVFANSTYAPHGTLLNYVWDEAFVAPADEIFEFRRRVVIPVAEGADVLY